MGTTAEFVAAQASNGRKAVIAIGLEARSAGTATSDGAAISAATTAAKYFNSVATVEPACVLRQLRYCARDTRDGVRGNGQHASGPFLPM